MRTRRSFLLGLLSLPLAMKIDLPQPEFTLEPERLTVEMLDNLYRQLSAAPFKGWDGQPQFGLIMSDESLNQLKINRT